MDMSEFNSQFSLDNHASQESLITTLKKDSNLEAFKAEHAGKPKEELTLILKELDGQLEVAKNNSPDDIFSLDLASADFGHQGEMLYKEGEIDAKIKIIQGLIAAENKFTIH